MRTAWLPFALVLGCSGSDSALFVEGPTSTVGSASATSAASTSSSSAGGQGGTGGQGGAATSTVATGGAGGTGGQGGGLGGGGGEPCEPDPNPCDGMPDGKCGAWADSCGTEILCGDEACGVGIPVCDEDAGVCICQSLSGYQLAVNTCNGLGLGPPFWCGDVGPTPDTPSTCVDTGVVNSDGHIIWCC